MVKEDYVTFEQAKLLKEKGFPQEWYHQNVYSTGEYDSTKFLEPRIGELYFGDADEVYWAEFNKWISAPTLSLVQKWLREEKDIHIAPECEPHVDSYGNILGSYYELKIIVFDFHNEESTTTYAETPFKTYKEALSAGIDKALELI